MKNNIEKFNRMTVEAYACSCGSCSAPCSSCGCVDSVISHSEHMNTYSTNYEYLRDSKAFSFQTIHQNGGRQLAEHVMLHLNTISNRFSLSKM